MGLMGLLPASVVGCSLFYIPVEKAYNKEDIDS